MRNIFVSDIHGYFPEFERLLKEVCFSKQDILYILGDMINDGDYSLEVLKYMGSLWERCRAILWNHEEMYLRNLERYTSENCNVPIWKYTRELAHQIKKEPGILEYLQSLPHYLEGDNFIGVHRGLIPGITFEDQKESLGLPESQKQIPMNWYETYFGEKMVLYGHWGTQVYRQQSHFPSFHSDGRLKTLCIDAGIKERWGSLGAFILEEQELVLIPDGYNFD
jgi:hypothetical protein